MDRSAVFMLYKECCDKRVVAGIIIEVGREKEKGGK